MKFLSGEEGKNALEQITLAAEMAKSSTCERSRCGSIILSGSEVIGAGINSPPGDIEGQRRCSYDKNSYDKKVTDKTCCIHAEERAIMYALKMHPAKIRGSRLYFARIDENGEIARSGKPYCTICSKLALDVGISQFILWHKEGICSYYTDEYNAISFEYRK